MTEAAVAEEEIAFEEVVSKPNPVTINRMSLEVESNNTFRVNVDVAVLPQDCLDEGFWCHIGGTLTPGDTIVVRPDNTAWELVLHVVHCGNQFAQVIKKAFFELAPTTETMTAPSRYKIEFAGTTEKYRFLLDGKVLKSGFATREIAAQAVKNHQMAVNRKQH